MLAQAKPHPTLPRLTLRYSILAIQLGKNAYSTPPPTLQPVLAASIVSAGSPIWYRQRRCRPSHRAGPDRTHNRAAPGRWQASRLGLAGGQAAKTGAAAIDARRIAVALHAPDKSACLAVEPDRAAARPSDASKLVLPCPPEL